MKKIFYPQMLPLNLDDSSLLRLYKKVISARSKITEFSVLLDRNIISDDLMWFFSLNESVQSTRIEGTQTTFDEVMEADVTQKFNLDTLEVKNYIDALTKGEILLRTIPISTRMRLVLQREILKDGTGKNQLAYGKGILEFLDE